MLNQLIKGNLTLIYSKGEQNMDILNENESKNDLLKNQRVVEHNDLITSVAKMDKIPLKIFELAVSHIDVDNPPKNNTVLVSKKVLYSFFDVNDSDRHIRFKNSIQQMQKQAFFEIKVVEGKGFKYKSILPIPFVEWNDYSDDVLIRFDEEIMPYLIDLKTNFTQYLITDIMGLNSKYSIILYKWLSMNYNQFEHYEHSINRTPAQLEKYKNPIITIEDFRKMTDTLEEYERFQSLESRVIKKAVDEISEFTHYKVNYEKVRSGRYIKALKFVIDKKESQHKLDYKDEQQDPDYLEGKRRKQEDDTIKFLEVQKAPYTQKLLSNALIDVQTLLNQEIMLSISEFLYPLYQEIEAIKGTEGLEKHMSYVFNKKEDYSKKNITKYLVVAAKNYLGRIQTMQPEKEPEKEPEKNNVKDLLKQLEEDYKKKKNETL